MRAAYIDEPPDMLAFLVSASSFDDLIDNVEFLSGSARRISASRGRSRRRGAEAAAERRATVGTRRLTAATVSVISARTDEARVGPRSARGDRDTLSRRASAQAERRRRARASRARSTCAEVDALAAQSAALAAPIPRRAGRSRLERTGCRPRRAHLARATASVVSGFGMRWGRMHEGIDIAASFGTPNRAAAAGTVIYAGWLGGYGNLVVVDHGNGLATAYAHASSILVGVGQPVSPGRDRVARRLDRATLGAAPPLRGARQRRRRRSAAVSLSGRSTRLRSRRAESATELTRWRSGSARQRSSSPSP